MTNSEQTTKSLNKLLKDFFGSWKTAAQNALISGIVSAVISGGVLIYGTARLETSKGHIAEMVRQQSQLDVAESAMFVQIGLYTNKVFEKNNAGDKDQLQSAIIATELQINRLISELPKSKHEPLLKYSSELETLSKSLRDVKSRQDLGNLYASAQRILELHDSVADVVRKNMDVAVF